MKRFLGKVFGAVLRAVTRLLTGATARWQGEPPSPGPCVYFANHASHIDFVLLWTLLPPAVRERTRPVAAADYWDKGGIRGFIIHEVFRGVLIDRRKDQRQDDPIALMTGALEAGDALILFPEGTRNTTDALLPFKSGLFHIGRSRPETTFVPVWIDNLNRVMPKGKPLPVPLLCGLTFGAPLRLADGEEKDVFLARARKALLELKPS